MALWVFVIDAAAVTFKANGTSIFGGMNSVDGCHDYDLNFVAALACIIFLCEGIQQFYCVNGR